MIPVAMRHLGGAWTLSLQYLFGLRLTIVPVCSDSIEPPAVGFNWKLVKLGCFEPNEATLLTLSNAPDL
jgi:hypothetical protein